MQTFVKCNEYIFKIAWHKARAHKPMLISKYIDLLCSCLSIIDASNSVANSKNGLRGKLSIYASSTSFQRLSSKISTLHFNNSYTYKHVRLRDGRISTNADPTSTRRAISRFVRFWASGGAKFSKM